jgi:CheY-like chemotaxis protein
MTARVLLVEDNDVNRYLVRFLLEKGGYEVATATNGVEAIEQAQALLPQLILMDIQMPVMDGITAASTIRDAERKTGRRRTPIVALTANALTHQVEEYLAVGMDAHVAKPIEIAKLYDAISAVLNAAATGAQASGQSSSAA